MLRLRKLLMLLMMLVLPAQGIAAVFAPLHKALATPSAAMPCHDSHNSHNSDANFAQHETYATYYKAGEETTAPDNAPNTETDSANHLCCHQVYTCTPSRALTTPAQKFSDVSRFVLPLTTLFIPDSPDRPPRG
jgi:hypothetical protein